MFKYCPIGKFKCPFAGYSQGNLHCGIASGSLAETKVNNMKFCPKKDLVKKQRKHK